MRALESQMGRARTNCALEGLSEAIVLLRKGALQGTHRESHAFLRPIEGEDACNTIIFGSIVWLAKSRESRP